MSLSSFRAVFTVAAFALEVLYTVLFFVVFAMSSLLLLLFAWVLPSSTEPSWREESVAFAMKQR